MSHVYSTPRQVQKVDEVLVIVKRRLIEAIQTSPGKYRYGLDEVDDRIARMRDVIIANGIHAIDIHGYAWTEAYKTVFPRQGGKPTYKAWVTYFTAK